MDLWLNFDYDYLRINQVIQKYFPTTYSLQNVNFQLTLPFPILASAQHQIEVSAKGTIKQILHLDTETVLCQKTYHY